MSPSGTIGIAVHGAGNVATGHLNAYLRNPACRVLAIGSRTAEGAARKARELGLDPGGVGIYDSIDALLAHPGVEPSPSAPRTPGTPRTRSPHPERGNTS